MVHRFPSIRIAVAVMTILLSFAAFAQPVGKATGYGSSIDWQTNVSGHHSITIRALSPSGELFTKTVSAGRALSLSVRDLGANPEDGVYRYELIVTPTVAPGLAKKLADARAANDEAAARKALRDAGITETIQSGSFTVEGGKIVYDEDAVEGNSAVTDTDSARGDGPADSRNQGVGTGRTGKVGTDDQVIPDDLIVQQSLCVGFDCVDGESFGFDTIRMKENNTRVKFEDTSTGSFPTNDWQLTANDSASGGASKFSVEDITGAKVPMTITAGASTNSIFVDSTGRVGFRTGTPVLDLHVATSNTPALRLEQNNSGGFTAQTWDVAGNEANFFVRDVTGGSRLSLRIRPGAPTSSLDISASGAVGVGTASPQLKLHASGTGGQAMGISDDVNTKWLWLYNGASSSGDAPAIGFPSSSSLRFGPSTNVNTSGFTERMRLTSAGSLGIGTLTPSSRLHVDGGDIRVSNGSFIDDGTTLNVPDYVFEPGYSLMPIENLAEFIRKNKHLPNVPPATAVKAQGLNISQFQMRLLEKVEELTLYTLAQHEENKKLQERIEALEKQIEQKQ